jgi:YVTN family beta-propeller protein
MSHGSAGRQKICAGNSLSKTVSVVDTNSNRVRRNIKTEDGPWGRLWGEIEDQPLRTEDGAAERRRPRRLVRRRLACGREVHSRAAAG